MGGIASRWVCTTQGAVHCYSGVGSGSVPNIVCIHGLGSSASSFASTLLRLRSSARKVSAVDLPGHGRSPAPHKRLSAGVLIRAVDETLHALTRTPALLVGNSLGGGLALRFALRHPERVSALVLTSPAGAPLAGSDLRELLSAFEFLTVRDGRRFFERLYHQVPPLRTALAWDLKRALARPHLRDLVASLDEVPPFSAAELGAIQPPTLVLWGRSDELMPRSARAFFEQHLPAHGSVEVLDNVGHSPHLEAPARFTERLIAFAQSHGLHQGPARPVAPNPAEPAL